MTPVEGEELERMKHYLNVYQLQQQNDGGLDVDLVENNQASKPAGSFVHLNHMDTANTGPSGLNHSGLDNHLFSEQDKNVDWTRVGKVYKGTEQLESIIEKEMARLKIVMDKRINAQDIELEEKALIARGGKKK